jgi:hypothetical protein
MGRVITNHRLPRVAGFNLQLNDKIYHPAGVRSMVVPDPCICRYRQRVACFGQRRLISEHKVRNEPNFMRFGGRTARLKGPLDGRQSQNYRVRARVSLEGLPRFENSRNVEMFVWPGSDKEFLKARMKAGL